MNPVFINGTDQGKHGYVIEGRNYSTMLKRLVYQKKSHFYSKGKNEASNDAN